MKTITIILGLLALVNTACGMSPIANHSSPNRTPDNRILRGTDDKAACDFYFQTQDLCAKMTWVTEPTRNDEGSFKLTFFSSNQTNSDAPVLIEPAAATVFVKLWMSAMGHGSQKVVTTHVRDDQGSDLPGVYQSTEVYFVMSGPWDIVVQLKDASGNVIDSAKVAYQAQ